MASFPVDFTLNKLDKLITSEAKLLLGLEDEIEYCKTKLEFLRGFLVDADQKRRQIQHESVRVWVKQLREVAYDLEDVVDEYTVKIDMQRMGLAGWRASPWLHCCITQLSTRHQLASQILKIKATLEGIARNKAEIPDLIHLSSTTQDFSSIDARINNISDRFLPDKAIDLIDEAGSRVRLRHAQLPEEAKELDKELRHITKEKNEAVRNQDFEKAGELRDREMELKAQISAFVDKGKEMSKAESEAGETGPIVTEADIQHIVLRGLRCRAVFWAR